MQTFYPLLAFSRLSSSWHLHLSRIDSVTQLELRDAYYDRLTSEFARAKRLNDSLAIIKVAIDSLNEIAAIHGIEVTNILLSQTAMIIKSSSRVNDFVYRTGENEFSLILPHTPIKGAAIRAERLRRIVEMHEFIGYSAGHATISMGISEFPSLAETAESLDQTATEALTYIQKRSVNKVCLYSSGVNG
jgi:diguanylate cyclase (GGDEF)-like protein